MHRIYTKCSLSIRSVNSLSLNTADNLSFSTWKMSEKMFGKCHMVQILYILSGNILAPF